jgi:P4 family phage/plasmid primase-like protien
VNKYSPIEAHNNMTCVVSHLSTTGLPVDPVALLAIADGLERGGANTAKGLRKLALSTSPDGKLRAQWSPASTGRLYCKPALQGLPRSARGAVGDGKRVVITADWKACHLYLMGHLASDEVLLADLDDGTALSFIGDAVGADRAKAALLAYINGAAQDRAGLDAVFMGEEARYAKSGSWILTCRDRALKGLGVSWGGHSLKVDAEKHYAAPGLLLQHVEAQAMIDAARSLIKALEPLRGAELALVLHDELLCLSHPGDAPAVKQALSQAMGEGMSTALGIDPAPPVRVKMGWTWGDASEGELGSPPAMRSLTRAQWAAHALENAQDGSKEVEYGLMVASVDCASRVAVLCSTDPKLKRRVSALAAQAQDWTGDDAQAPQGEQDGPVFESGSESELAERLLAVVGSEVVFDGVRFWECGADDFWFESNLLSRLCKFDGAAIRGSAMRRVIVSASRARGAVEILKSSLVQDRRYDPNFFDAATKGAVFKGGMIHTLDGEVRKVRREDRLVRGAEIDVAYDPMASCPRWLAYLGEVWQGAPDCDTRIAYLREWLGAAVWGVTTNYRGQPLLVGEAMTGKSVAVKLVQALFAPERRSALLPSDVCGDKAETYLAALQGKTLNAVPDLPAQAIRYVGLMNSILSGEEVKARLLFKECFTFQPRAAWLMGMNKLPQVSDTSNGFWSRFVVLSFDRVFTGKDADPELFGKLKDERAGIIQWAWEGLLNLKARGFYEEPTSSKAAKGEWRSECDTALQYIGECCAPDGDALYTCSAVYDHYQEWCAQRGLKPKNANTFGKAFLGKFEQSFVKKVGGKPTKVRKMGHSELSPV